MNKKKKTNEQHIVRSANSHDDLKKRKGFLLADPGNKEKKREKKK